MSVNLIGDRQTLNAEIHTLKVQRLFVDGVEINPTPNITTDPGDDIVIEANGPGSDVNITADGDVVITATNGSIVLDASDQITLNSNDIVWANKPTVVGAAQADVTSRSGFVNAIGPYAQLVPGDTFTIVLRHDFGTVGVDTFLFTEIVGGTNLGNARLVTSYSIATPIQVLVAFTNVHPTASTGLAPTFLIQYLFI